VYSKLQLGESSQDEIARLERPLSVMELLGSSNLSDLNSEIGPTERWFDLKSWWPGRDAVEPHHIEHAHDSKVEELQSKEGNDSAGTFLQRNMDWIKDKMKEHREQLGAERQQELEAAEARIQVRLHWKPVGDIVPIEERPKVPPVSPLRRMQGVMAAKASLLEKGHSVLPPEKMVGQPLGISQSEDAGINTTEADDETTDESDYENWKGWPTHILGVTVKRIDRVKCSEEDHVTFKVVASLPKAMNREGYMCSKTDKRPLDGFTAQETKAAYPVLGSMGSLATKSGGEHEQLRAHKIGLLLAHEVPHSVICEVMEELDPKNLKQAMSEAMARASRLRSVEYLENMTFFLHMDEFPPEITFTVYSIKEKVETEVYKFQQKLDKLAKHEGAHININMKDMENMAGVNSFTEARIYADLQIWPFVKHTKPLERVTQISLQQELEEEKEKKLMNGKYCMVHIISAQNLRKADIIGHSDPFCVLKLGAHKKAKELDRTKVIDNTPSPVWNHDPIVVQWQEESALKFEVWDQDLVGPGDLLGGVVVKKADAMKGLFTDLYLGDGDATLRVKICPAKYARMENKNLELVPSEVKWQDAKPKPVFEVYIERAIKLKAANFIGGKSDPYVIVKLSDKKILRTPVIYDTCDPVWNFGPEELVDDNEAKMYFEVKDKDLVGSKPLGHGVLKREQLDKGFDGLINLGRDGGQLKVTVTKLAQGSTKEPFLLKVSVLRAKDLRNTDMMGLSDPFVICKVRGRNVFQTKVVWDNLNPEWNHPPQEVQLEDFKDIKFDVFDKDLFSQGDFLGSASLTRAMCEKGYIGALSLGEGNGKLEVEIERMPDSPDSPCKRKKQGFHEVVCDATAAKGMERSNSENMVAAHSRSEAYTFAGAVEKCSLVEAFFAFRAKVRSLVLAPARPAVAPTREQRRKTFRKASKFVPPPTP